MIHHNSAIQEGVLRDIVELLSDNVNGFVDPGDTDSFIGKLLNSRNTGNYFRSITKATSNLVLTFPMIVDNSVSIETASMVSKAVEKKIVLMLQMLFSAISVTNNKDAFDFVSKIHKNLTSDDVLSYINKMDSIPYRESTTLDFDQINKDLVRLIKEDSSRELSYDLRPALEAGKKRIAGGRVRVGEIRNEWNGKGDEPRVSMSTKDYETLLKDADGVGYTADYYKGKRDELLKQNGKVIAQRDRYADYLKKAQKFNSADRKKILDMQKERERLIAQRDLNMKHLKRAQKLNSSDRKKILDMQKERERLIAQRDLNMKHLKRAQKLNSSDRKKMLDLQKESDRRIKELEDRIEKQSFYVDTKIDQPEIKKANEMVPSIMVVRFRSGEHNEAVGEAVIGVKVKLIYVNQADMIDRIILKSGDQNRLFEFLKATTGEISMFKDFMFALDRAKLDIFSKSAKSSPIWKLLERRSNVSRANSFFNNNNGAGTAIATLLVSQDTMDILKKEHNFNQRNTSKLINIMTDYSAMGFIITNDVTEKVQMLFDDNDLSFETLSYSSLEREDKNQYKKVINLLAGK